MAFYSRRCSDEQILECHTICFGYSECTRDNLDLMPLGNWRFSARHHQIIPLITHVLLEDITIRGSMVFVPDLGLLLNALSWTLNNPDNDYRFKWFSEVALMAWRVRIARLVPVVYFPIGMSPTLHIQIRHCIWIKGNICGYCSCSFRALHAAKL